MDKNNLKTLFKPYSTLKYTRLLFLPLFTVSNSAILPISLNDLAALLLKLTNRQDLEVKHTDPRPGDIIHSYADISKAKKLLGFIPQYDQKDGLIEYLRWYSKNNGGF